MLKELLKSIETFNDLGDDLEVIVVDNSPPGEKVYSHIAKSWKFNFAYFENQNNGFGAGNNLGVKNAKGKYIAFINPDIVFVEPVFGEVIKRFENDSSVVMAGLRLISSDGSWALSYFYGYNVNLLKKIFLRYCNRKGIFVMKDMYTSGADMFVERDLFLEAGGFDENIFMYYEEIDLSVRIQKLVPYAKRIYIHSKKAIHLEGACTEPNIKFLENEFSSCKYVGEKHGFNYIKKLKVDYRYLLLVNKIKVILKRSVCNTGVLKTYKSFIEDTNLK